MVKKTLVKLTEKRLGKQTERKLVRELVRLVKLMVVKGKVDMRVEGSENLQHKLAKM